MFLVQFGKGFFCGVRLVDVQVWIRGLQLTSLCATTAVGDSEISSAWRGLRISIGFAIRKEIIPSQFVCLALKVKGN